MGSRSHSRPRPREGRPAPLDVRLVKALGLHLEARKGSGRDRLDEAANPELAMDRTSDPLRDLGRRLDDAPQLVHLADPRQLDAVLADLVEAANDRLDRAREHVHAAHREHVIHAAGDPAGELYERAPARTSSTDRSDAIACAVTDDRHAPATEVRK